MREVDHSSPSSAEAEIKWNCKSIPPVRFHGVDTEYFSFTPSPFKTEKRGM